MILNSCLRLITGYRVARGRGAQMSPFGKARPDAGWGILPGTRRAVQREKGYSRKQVGEAR